MNTSLRMVKENQEKIVVKKEPSVFSVFQLTLETSLTQNH